MVTRTPLQDLEGAEHAYNRVKAELDALKVEELAVVNVDVVSAASIALGVSDRILSFRERMAKLPEFDMRCVDNLVDYIKATWYAYVTNLPEPEPADAEQMIQEVVALRAKLLRWSNPLIEEGFFEAAAIAKIREGSGNKDTPSDLVALVGLYRAKWPEIQDMCNVTEENLNRGAQIGPAVFALVSRREARGSAASSDAALRVRRTWALLDNAYTECRRALQYLRFKDGDADSIAPSLRKNTGTRTTSDSNQTSPNQTSPNSTNPGASAAVNAGVGDNTGVPQPQVPAPQPAPLPPGAGPVIGSGGSGGPFTSTP
jgi:hypothetical protein